MKRTRMQNNLHYNTHVSEGVKTLSKIYFPDMCTYEQRIATYENWPKEIIQSPKSLARCGFFYLQSEDKVACFSCGIMLHKWTPADDPWIEHAIYSNLCPFLLLNKCKYKMTEIETSYFEKLMEGINTMGHAIIDQLPTYLRTCMSNK